MANVCTGTVSYFCCYPDKCGCDLGCCRGSNCQYQGCDQPTQSTGACCNCNSSYLGYAWPCTPCCIGSGYGFAPNCNGTLTFSADCVFYQGGVPKFDVGPATNLGRMADFTKPMFMLFAPLSQGLIHNMRALYDGGSTC